MIKSILNSFFIYKRHISKNCSQTRKHFLPLNVAKNPQLFSLSFQIANENISDLKYLCGKKQGNYKFTTAACNHCKSSYGEAVVNSVSWPRNNGFRVHFGSNYMRKP